LILYGNGTRVPGTALKSLQENWKQIYALHYSASQQHQQPPTGFLYHYTDIAGLKGIVETKCLWATSAFFLNDSSEISYGSRLVANVLDNCIENVGSKCFAVRHFLGVLKWRFEHEISAVQYSTPVYLTCFCETDNLLSQWRGYASRGGYSIGFQISDDNSLSGVTVTRQSL
jgi:hypothetical protein